jgi:hypothetical protein
MLRRDRFLRDPDVYMSLTRLAAPESYRVDVLARNVPPIDPFATGQGLWAKGARDAGLRILP